MRTRRHASRMMFTLVEMLIVMAVISVLVALLLPALRNAFENARILRCANQLKQIGIAAHTYAGDNYGFLPPYIIGQNYTRDTNGNYFNSWTAPFNNKLRHLFFPTLHPEYIRDPSVFYCPSSESVKYPDKWNIYENGVLSGYNLYFLANTSPLKIGRTSPETRIGWDLGCTQYGNNTKKNHINPLDRNGPPIGQNMLYFDLRVRWLHYPDAEFQGNH